VRVHKSLTPPKAEGHNLLHDQASARLGALDFAGEGRALHPRRRVYSVPDQRVLEPLRSVMRSMYA
jgi:hypothetical protein